MKLSKTDALCLSLAHWVNLADTGSDDKLSWAPAKKLGPAKNNCFLCEYTLQQRTYDLDCRDCPLIDYWRGGACDGPSSQWTLWRLAETPQERQEQAEEIVEMLYDALTEHLIEGEVLLQ